MEAPGFLILLYIMFTLPPTLGIDKLPPANWIMAALFVCPPTLSVPNPLGHSLLISPSPSRNPSL